MYNNNYCNNYNSYNYNNNNYNYNTYYNYNNNPAMTMPHAGLTDHQRNPTINRCADDLIMSCHAIHPTDKRLSLLGTMGGTVMLADTVDGRLEFEITRLHAGMVTAMECLGSQSYVTAGDDGLIYFIRCNRNGTNFICLDGHKNSEIVDLIWDPDDYVLISSDKTGLICNWDLKSNKGGFFSFRWHRHLKIDVGVVLPFETVRVDKRMIKKAERGAAELGILEAKRKAGFRTGPSEGSVERWSRMPFLHLNHST